VNLNTTSSSRVAPAADMARALSSSPARVLVVERGTPVPQEPDN
jgi:hypothetical protein